MRRLVVAAALVALAPARALAHSHCAEVSDVVGRERCASFGSGWSPPPWVRLVWSVGGTRLSTTQTAGEPPVMAGVVVSPDAAHQYDLVEVRSGFGIGRYLELHSTVQIGGASDDGAPDALVFGAGLSALGNLDLGWLVVKPELMFGYRMIAATRPELGMKDLSTDRFVLAPRLSFEVPVSPHVALGVTLGTDLENIDDRSAGAYLLMRFPSLAF